MKKITLGYYKTGTGRHYFHVLCVPPGDQIFNPKRDTHATVGGHHESNNKFVYSAPARYKNRVIIERVPTNNYTWMDGTHLIKIGMGEPRWGNYLMMLGEERFNHLKDAVMAYNLRYNNNSELDEDMYIHHFANKRELNRKYWDLVQENARRIREARNGARAV